MDRGRDVYVDGISRILGTLALIVAGGAAAFFYTENQQLRSELTRVETAFGSPGQAQAFYEKWNQQLNEEFAGFQAQADLALKAEQSAIEARDRTFDETMTQLAKRGEFVGEDTRTVAAKVDPTAAENQLDPTAVGAQQLDPLRIALNEMQPGEGAVNYVTVRNDSDLAISIGGVSFRPRPNSEFEYDRPKTKPAHESDLLTIDFNPADNLAGKHSHYRREFARDSIAIPARTTVRIAVEIEDATYRGWGFEGDLTLEYGEDSKLTIPTARGVFVAEST